MSSPVIRGGSDVQRRTLLRGQFNFRFDSIPQDPRPASLSRYFSQPLDNPALWHYCSPPIHDQVQVQRRKLSGLRSQSPPQILHLKSGIHTPERWFLQPQDGVCLSHDMGARNLRCSF